jgi:hypothetical protein
MRVFMVAGVALLAAVAVSCGGRQGAVQGGAKELRGVLSGTIVEGESGKPIGGAFVYAYREMSSSLVGPSDYISGESAADGTYHLNLLPGDYYIVARKRLSGDNTGPLSKGDLYSETPVKPISVSLGKTRTLTISLLLRGEPMFFKQNRERVTDTRISGLLVDEAGNPVAGGFAMAYVTDDLKRLPEYASTVTNTDGAFTLYLPQGGTYFLSARSALKGKPEKGELYGVYKGASGHAVTVADHMTLSGIRIVLAPFSGVTMPGKPY